MDAYEQYPEESFQQQQLAAKMRLKSQGAAGNAALIKQPQYEEIYVKEDGAVYGSWYPAPGNKMPGGLFHAPDVLGICGHDFNWPHVTNLADDLFGPEVFGGYAAPVGVMHDPTRIHIEGQYLSTVSRAYVNQGKATLNSSYTVADQAGNTSLTGVGQLHPLPKAFLEHTKAVTPTMGIYTRTFCAYPPIVAQQLPPTKLSGPLSPTASTTLERSLMWTGKTDSKGSSAGGYGSATSDTFNVANLGLSSKPQYVQQQQRF